MPLANRSSTMMVASEAFSAPVGSRRAINRARVARAGNGIGKLHMLPVVIPEAAAVAAKGASAAFANGLFGAIVYQLVQLVIQPQEFIQPFVYQGNIPGNG